MIWIRPEDIVIRRKSIKEENDNIILPGIIEKISYSGREAVYHVRVNDDVRLLVNIYCPDELSIDEIGSQVELEISKNSMMLFNKKSGLRCYWMMKFLYSLNNIWNYVIIFSFSVIALLLIYPLFSIFFSSFIDNESGLFILQNYSDILGRR